jgi:hypothetical protein
MHSGILWTLFHDQQYTLNRHPQQYLFQSEIPRCSGRLWQLWRNLIPSDWEIHGSRRPGNVLRCILTPCTLRLECGDVYVPSEPHVCYTLRRGWSYAAAIYTPSGDVYAFVRQSATFYLSPIAIYQMSHIPYLCLALRCCRLLQECLRLKHIACHRMCFAIIVFYRSEIDCLICTLCSMMPSVLPILSWFIIGLQCFFLLLRIVAILALLPGNITGSQVTPSMASVLYIPGGSIISVRCFVFLIR